LLDAIDPAWLRSPFDAMKNAALQAFLLLIALAAADSCAGEPQILPDYLKSGSSATTREATPEARQRPMIDFQKRLEAAIESRDLVVIQALYQTNGIAAEDLKVEMARWPSLLDGEAKAGVALFFKELSTLPPRARVIHTERAHSLTKYEVTHLVFVRLPAGYTLTFPLVLVGDWLLIVPSEKRLGKGIGGTSGSQPFRSGTNQTPLAAGSRR
jgi:hypothetical protein